MNVGYTELVNQLQDSWRILICLSHFPSKPGEVMNQRVLIRVLLVLTLLEGRRVSCQTECEPLRKPASPSGACAISPCKPDAKEYADQIVAGEDQRESAFWSEVHAVEITIQKSKKDGQALTVPDAVNFYQGEVTFGTKPRFQKIMEIVNWRPFWSGFDLRGFAEMCFLDPYHFNGSNYELRYRGQEMLFGRLCWVYRVTPKKHSKGWRFQGTIWVLPDHLTIIRAKGAYHPMRRILWFFLVEDHWYCFNLWRKEISPGDWVPDYTCTGVDVAASDFSNPAFSARIAFSNGNGDSPSAASENACGLGLGQFPTGALQPKPNSGLNHK